MFLSPENKSAQCCGSSPKLFRSHKDLPKPEEVKIRGKIPKWVKGTFMTVGPGKFDFDKNFTVEHYFDGYAIVSKFEISEDKVKFEKKFLESDAYKKAIIAQKPVVAEFGTKKSPDPTKGFFSRMVPSVLPELSDNGNISLFSMGNDVFATNASCYFRDLDPKTLQTDTKFDTNKCFGVNAASAHPLTDDAGYTYNIGASVLTGIKYNILQIPPGGKNQSPKDIFKQSKVISTIPSSHSTYSSLIHSFGMTKNYIILIEQPYVLNVSKLLSSVLKGSSSTTSDWMEWHPEFLNNFFIIEKDSGKVLKGTIVSEHPFFFVHIINCWEINDHIVIDLTAFPNPNSLSDMTLQKLRKSSPSDERDNSRGERYVIPLLDLQDTKEGVNMVALKSDARAVRKGNSLVLTPEIITEAGLEYPVINRRFLSKKTSFYWATGCSQKGYFENALGKVHATNKETILWRESEHYFLGEPMFVQNPSATTEDDGVLISAVIDDRDNQSDFLLFLDAKTMKELGRAEFKASIPQAVHGIFIPDK